ncbi:N,N-dimethylformamidase beta subunit family domain-containing protein [Streptomyces sp. CA-111067]|uniref:N,N-dimethylformamidase beta subunit family domain-containing protein n=1 Tax=Streptomyces sp. CA-111067 TaxID=3240046 RepID=UPI003D96C3F0
MPKGKWGRRVAGGIAGLLVVLAGGTGCSFSAARTSARLPVDATPHLVGKNISARQWSVARENALPGTSDWRLRDPGRTNAIEGYANRVSVLPGQSFTLYVSTTAAGFHVEAFRMGWYGGKQGRQVWASGQFHGQRQAGPKVVPGIYEVTAPWRPSAVVSTKGWPPGDYLLKLISDQGHDRWVTITVRSPSAAGRTVFVNAVTTWAAYNTWGIGTNVYGSKLGTVAGYAQRSRKASFDRPYNKGGSYFNWYELPMLSVAERMGLPLAYETDLDLDAHPAAFTRASALVFGGHDEYWSLGMRDRTLALRDAGTNVAFFSSNNAYRHIRLEPSALGPDRVVVVYKDAAEDPMILKDPTQTTQQWRLPPDPRPESVLTGVYYECNPVYAPYVVTDPGSWIFRGTGATAGSRYPGLVGVETDRLTSGVPVPRPIQVVASSPLTCHGWHTRSQSAYYTVKSGAGVFSSGTMNWSCAVYGTTGCRNHGQRPVPTTSGDFARRATENILRAFAAGPAGRAHPATDNYAQYVGRPGPLQYTH